jgi:hypothetical protein
MPRAMTPTQFTVFTNASASALKMSPRVTSIIVRDPWLVASSALDVSVPVPTCGSEALRELTAHAARRKADELAATLAERALRVTRGADFAVTRDALDAFCSGTLRSSQRSAPSRSSLDQLDDDLSIARPDLEVEVAQEVHTDESVDVLVPEREHG